MEYLKKSFSVAMPQGEKFRDNWDATFGKKKKMADWDIEEVEKELDPWPEEKK